MASQKDIEKLLEQHRLEHLYSGYHLYCWRNNQIIQFFGGTTSYWPDAQKIKADTLFDIGSLTKVIVTTTLIAKKVNSGEWNLKDSILSWIPEFEKTPLGNITLADLLNHRSGLASWAPVYDVCRIASPRRMSMDAPSGRTQKETETIQGRKHNRRLSQKGPEFDPDCGVGFL